MTCEQNYKSLLRAYCSAIKLDTCNEAYELINRNITLEAVFSDAIAVEREENSIDLSIEILVHKIDKKVALLEAQERNEDTDCAPEGLRGLLCALPGGGKSTLSKRLVLGLINKETDLLEKYQAIVPQAENICPILVQCKAVRSVSADQLAGADMEALLYALSEEMLGEAFCGVQKTAFLNMVQSRACNGELYVILDAWDEILDAEKEECLLSKLQEFAANYPKVHFLITARDDYRHGEKSFLPFSYKTDLFRIRPMTDQMQMSFAQNWYNVMVQDQKNRYVAFIEELRNPYYAQYIEQLERTPMNLSRLLGIYHRDGCLPINQVELYQKYTEDMLMWYGWKRTKRRLSADTISLLLSFFAWHLQSHGKLTVERDEAKAVIRACLEELDGYFMEELDPEEAELYLDELVCTSILEVERNQTLSFSHRLLQEFYAAVALVKRRRSDRRTPAELLQMHCLEKAWHEVTLFAVGMDSELAAHLVDLLACDGEREDDRRNLLCDILSYNVRMARVKKEKVYDYLFAMQISEYSILKMVTFLSKATKAGNEFKNYVEARFKASLAQNDTEYGYVQAIIASIEASQAGKMPLRYAEELLQRESEYDRMLAIHILTTIGWCKQVDIRVPNITDEVFVLSEEAKAVLKQMLQGERFNKPVMTCVKDCILCVFCYFREIVSDPSGYFRRLEQGDMDVEELLFAAPVVHRPMVKAEVLETYRDRLQKEIESKNEQAVFTLGICAAIGCFQDEAAYGQAFAQVDTLFPKPLRSPQTQEERRMLQLRQQRNQ